MDRQFIPLFITGIARSGTNLVGRMLNAHPEIAVAIDPYLPFFKSLRDALVIKTLKKPWQEFTPSMALQDYYYTDERIAILDLVQNGSLDMRLEKTQRLVLIEQLANRARIECSDLVGSFAGIEAEEYRVLLTALLNVISQYRGSTISRLIGFKDLWIIEFFTMLARAYPEARFVAVLRDPRAAAASMLGFKDKDPSQLCHTLSFVRHWRKYAAFIHLYRSGFFAERFHVVRYEDLLENPVRTARSLCSFLEVPFDDRMLDMSNFYDAATGAVWQGNSTFDPVMTDISRHAAQRWRTKLDPRITALIDFVCGPEMQLFGYAPVYCAFTPEVISGMLEYLIENNTESCSWRSDFQDPQQDFALELFRRCLLELPDPPRDASLIRRSFLFESLYDVLRANASRDEQRRYAVS
ncbi:MAG: sulfotransferase [Desulfobacterota bacterium]|nr:sulfotransferase [Thermodesulfobacteriota bacterium]